MKKLVLVALALAAVLAVAPAAKATPFSYSYGFIATGNPSLTGNFSFSLSGTTVTGASLDITGGIPGFPAGNAYTLAFGNLNLASGNGLLVFTGYSDTITLVDILGVWDIQTSGNYNNQGLTVFTPEPSSLLFLGTGLLLLAAGLFWKSRSKTQLAKQPNVIQAA